MLRRTGAHVLRWFNRKQSAQSRPTGAKVGESQGGVHRDLSVALVREPCERVGGARCAGAVKLVYLLFPRDLSRVSRIRANDHYVSERVCWTVDGSLSLSAR